MMRANRRCRSPDIRLSVLHTHIACMNTESDPNNEHYRAPSIPKSSPRDIIVVVASV